MKPYLPREIQVVFPEDIVGLIHSFVPHFPKKKVVSPSLQKELFRIQSKYLRGKNEMYLKEFYDFILD